MVFLSVLAVQIQLGILPLLQKISHVSLGRYALVDEGAVWFRASGQE
jgi:hypothetical protein